MQHGLAQGGEAGVGVLVGHVGLGGDLEDFAGLAFRGGDDDLESEARQHREGALRVTAVGLDERYISDVTFESANTNVFTVEGSLVRPPPSR